MKWVTFPRENDSLLQNGALRRKKQKQGRNKGGES